MRERESEREREREREKEEYSLFARLKAFYNIIKEKHATC